MGANPSHFAAGGADLPVERVNFHDVLEFLRRLNAGQASRTYRLPTEAEWEYACRAGTTTAFSTSDKLSKAQANVRDRVEGTGTTRVGTFPSNAWGLFDMHGNVWEWTADDFCPYPSESSIDPRPSCQSDLKVIRGGSWYFGADSARCALRYTHPPKELGFSLGFRVAADPRQE
jgi:sulfatase modifying factor 1